MDILKRMLSALLVLAMALTLLPGVPVQAEEAEAVAEAAEAPTLPDLAVTETVSEDTVLPTVPETAGPEETEPGWTIAPTETLVPMETEAGETAAPQETEPAETIAESDAAVVFAPGICGEKLTWTFDETTGTLTISGEGPMYGYYNMERPWADVLQQIRAVVIEEGVTSVGDGAFIGCESLRKVKLASTVELVDLYAFADCPELAEILFPDNVTTLAYAAFRNCSSLVRLDLPSSLETLEAGAFANCVSLEEITIPDGVMAFGYSTFQNCTSLTKVALPEKLQSIGAESFSGCISLTEMEFPAVLNRLGHRSFADCEGLTTLRFLGDAPVFEGNEIFSAVTAAAWYPGGNSTWTEDLLLNYGGSLTWQKTEGAAGEEIPDSGICGEDLNWTLDQATGTLTIVGDGEMADGCAWEPAAEKITSVEFAGNITKLGDNAFRGCSALTELVIPDTVQALGSSVFAGSGIQQILFAGAMPLMQDSTFSGLRAVVYYPAGNAAWEEAAQTEAFGGEITWKPWGIVLDTAAVTLVSGGKVTVTAAFQPFNVTRTNILWTADGDAVTLKTVGNTAVITAGELTEQTAVTLTAAPEDGRSAAVSVTVTVVPAGEEEELPPADHTLFSGKNLTLKATNPDTGKPYTAKQITWSMEEVYAPYAALAKNGKLTAKNVLARVRVEVVGTIVGREDDPVPVLVDIFPTVTQAEIRNQKTNALILNGKTVSVDVGSDPVTFVMNAFPTDTLQNVTWTVGDKKNAYAEYEIDGNVLTVSSPTGKVGTVTVKGVVDAGVRKTVSFKLNFGTFAEDITFLNTETELVSGKSLQMDAVLSPDNVTKPGITWSLKTAADKKVATLSAKGVLKAKTVYIPTPITVVATSKDGVISEEYTLTIQPSDPGLLILKHNGQNVTKSTINVDLNEDAAVILTAENFGTGTEEAVQWKTSSKTTATVENGTVTFLKAGSVTITATAGDGRRATVTLKAAKLASAVTISGDTEVASGKGITLKATVENAASKQVTWSIARGSEYAKISSSGKLTAHKDITSEQKVLVRATAKDGSGIYGEKEVAIRPIAQGVQIYSQQGGRTLFSVRTNDNWWVRSNTTLEWAMNGDDTLQLSAHVYPYYGEDDARNAIQGVIWKVSGNQIASVDENGLVTCHKPGTVTITATAKDNSNKKVSFKLKLVKNITGLALEDQVLAGGKSLDLSKLVKIVPGDTTTKNLTWELLEGDEYASLSSRGVLKAQKTAEKCTLRIRVTAGDALGVSETCTVELYPGTVSRITLWDGDANVTGKTLNVEAGDTLTLLHRVEPADAAEQVTWTSSNKAVAQIDPDTGVITAYMKGTVTITCAAADGSGRKATVKLRIE